MSHAKTFSVKGFQYEPERSNDDLENVQLHYDDDDEEDIEASVTASRSVENLNDWCHCGSCKGMPTAKECLCCVELDAIKYFHLQDKECITQHEDFHSIVLLKNNLWTALVALHDRESRGLCKRDEVQNKSYRYAAYRQFCWFIHTRLGRGVRRVIPACVVSAIRKEYPSEDGTYIGFLEGTEVPEMDFTWVNECSDE